MVRFALGIVIFMSAGPLASSQNVSSQPPAIIRLNLPPDTPSEIVHINYFMTGPFGGYGGFVTPEKGQSMYEIVAASDEKPADRVKLIVYVPGCQIETFDLRTQSQTVSRQLQCTPLAQVALHGQITPAPATRQPSEVDVTYLATWDHQFFGIADGAVTAIRVTAGIPDHDGNFDVTLPDFSAQTNLGEGEFRFTLREIKTGNIIAFLHPANDAHGRQDLKVEAFYPPVTRFSSTPP